MATPNRSLRGRQARLRGAWGETLCVWWLRFKGYQILGRSVTVGRGSGAGEIDIIAKRGRLLAFIEVKARPDFSQAASAISTFQQQRLIRAAEAFLAHRPELANCDIRFDAMLVAPRRFPHHLRDAWRDPR